MKPIAEYAPIDARSSVRLRGANAQSTTTLDGLLYRPPTPGRTTQLFGSREGGLTAAPGGGIGESMVTGIGLGAFELFNSSAGSITVAVGVRIPNTLWRAGQWVDAAATPFSDDTADAQSTTTGDFALNTTVNNDGFVIHSAVKFNALSINVGTAGDASTNAMRFVNPAGNNWSALSTLYFSESLAATGERIWFWPTLGEEWGRVQNIGLSGIPASRYAVNVRSTTAPAATVALANAIEVYHFYFVREALGANAAWQWTGGSMESAMIPGDALVAFFGTADDLNRLTALIRPRV